MYNSTITYNLIKLLSFDFVSFIVKGVEQQYVLHFVFD